MAGIRSIQVLKEVFHA